MIPEITLDYDGSVVVERITLTATGERFRAWRVDLLTSDPGASDVERDADDIFIYMNVGSRTRDHDKQAGGRTALRITDASGWKVMRGRTGPRTFVVTVWDERDLRVEYVRKAPF